MMTTPKCPLCGKLLKLSTIENKGQLHFFACYKCNYQLRMSPRKDFALEYAEKFISKFPPIMRLNQGDNVMVHFSDDTHTVLYTNVDRGKIYLQDVYGNALPYDVDEIKQWPWELEQKGGSND
ncbi:MAG: hypothetical protein KHX31_08655 [Akkermansia sp.]|uniref:hypothetical protein n=1 Tax=Akkermansia sp. TaxID=1872421 RepID=UPI0025C3E14A|nr:hypothetical protein [Akkermansia sp.]MBS5508692.1 hypothetical protein [Akkermansia sp.]